MILADIGLNSISPVLKKSEIKKSKMIFVERLVK